MNKMYAILEGIKDRSLTSMTSEKLIGKKYGPTSDGGYFVIDKVNKDSSIHATPYDKKDKKGSGFRISAEDIQHSKSSKDNTDMSKLFAFGKWYQIIENVVELSRDDVEIIDESKAFSTDTLIKFVSSNITSKLKAKKIEVVTGATEGNDFYVEIKFWSPRELKKSDTEKLSKDIIDNINDIPSSDTGGGFGINILSQEPSDKGFIVDLEIYN